MLNKKTGCTGQYVTKYVNKYQVRNSNLINNEGDKVYGLYSMHETREWEHLGLFIGKFVDYDDNVIEEYKYNKLKADRHKLYVGMHYTNDPIYSVYDAAYVNDKNKIRMIDALQKKWKNKIK